MKLLELKNKLKKKKPDFIRQDAHKKLRLKKKWRRPKGLQSKVRLALKGYRKKPSQGYRSPTKAKGLDRDGLLCVGVATVEQLNKLDAAKEKALIPSSVGKKRSLELLQAALDKGIQVKNYKNIQETIKGIQDSLKTKKKRREELKQQKQKKVKAAEEKKEKASSESKKAGQDETKSSEKKQDAKKEGSADKRSIEDLAAKPAETSPDRESQTKKGENKEKQEGSADKKPSSKKSEKSVSSTAKKGAEK